MIFSCLTPLFYLSTLFKDLGCFKLLKLRDWGKQIKEKINDYLEMRESGINLGKQNHKLIPNYEDELDINILGLDVN
jgi:hypothetical protein